jgi:WD40 repeat protein
VATLDTPTTVNATRFSSDGHYIAVGSGSSLQIVEVNNNTLSEVAVYSIGETVNSVRWSEDNKYILVGSGLTVRLIRFETETLGEISKFTLAGTVYDVVPDGNEKYLGVHHANGTRFTLLERFPSGVIRGENDEYIGLKVFPQGTNIPSVFSGKVSIAAVCTGVIEEGSQFELLKEV